MYTYIALVFTHISLYMMFLLVHMFIKEMFIKEGNLMINWLCKHSVSITRKPNAHYHLRNIAIFSNMRIYVRMDLKQTLEWHSGRIAVFLLYVNHSWLCSQDSALESVPVVHGISSSARLSPGLWHVHKFFELSLCSGRIAFYGSLFCFPLKIV